MKIHDLLIETQLEEQQLDELNVAQGIGKVASGVGKAVGGVQGAWKGAKQAFGQARQQTAQNVQQAVSGGAAPAQATQPGQPAAQASSAQSAPIEPTMEPAQSAPVQEPQAVNPGVPTSDETSVQSNQVSNVAATNKAKVGAPQGRQAVDNAIQTVGQVRTDRRQQVIDYAQEKLDQAEQELLALRKNAGIQQQAQPNLQVQQGGKAPAQAPQQAVA